MSAFGQETNVTTLAPLARLTGLLGPIFAAHGATDALSAAREARHEIITSEAHGSLAALSIAVEGLAELAFRRDLDDALFSDVVTATAQATGIAPEGLRFDLCRRALMHLRWASLPPELALTAQLRLVRAASSFTEISVWRDGDRGPEWIASAGEAKPTPALALAARRFFHNGSNGDELLTAVEVTRWKELHTVLVARAKQRESEERRRGLLEVAAVAVRPALERDLLLARDADRERALLESTERRLMRLGLDLHDGPLQELAVLAEDVRLFRRQLAPSLAGSDRDAILLGRIDDIEARLVAMDGELRDLARSSETPSFVQRPLHSVLEDEVATFRRRTDIAATLDIQGELTALTDSQRIALVRIVQESLANVREHSHASEVDVSVAMRGGGVEAAIQDNGHGFDVERTLMRAAREGRLGLVGMGERVRLLGGVLDVQSAPGGPTIVAVSLAEWRPVPGAAAAEWTKRGA